MQTIALLQPAVVVQQPQTVFSALTVSIGSIIQAAVLRRRAVVEVVVMTARQKLGMLGDVESLLQPKQQHLQASSPAVRMCMMLLQMLTATNCSSIQLLICAEQDGKNHLE